MAIIYPILWCRGNTSQYISIGAAEEVDQVSKVLHHHQWCEAMRKVVKGAEMTMQNALLLQVVHQLQSENQNRREEEEQREQNRPYRPQKCSNCGIFEHDRPRCPSR